MKTFISALLISSIAFAQDVPDAGVSDAPEILAVKGARIWVPEGGFVERGEGVYLNKTMSVHVATTLTDASDNAKKLADENTKLKQEVAMRFPTVVVVIIGVVGLGLGVSVGAGVVLATKK